MMTRLHTHHQRLLTTSAAPGRQRPGFRPLLAFHMTPEPSPVPPGEPVKPPSSVLLVFWLIATTADELPALPQPETPGTLAALADQLAADEQDAHGGN